MKTRPPRLSQSDGNEPFFINESRQAREDLFGWFSKYRLLLSHEDHPRVIELKKEIGPVLDGFEEIRRRQEKEATG